MVISLHICEKMLTPLLTEYDPALRSEGSIDPLGLYAIADSLALRLVPGLRERMQHPRFLTATAVSLAVCSAFDVERVAADGTSEPWQVFEWYLVEGLVRTIKDEGQLRGLSGRSKAATALRYGEPLCAKNYLKTSSVFGFHGVYRLLSKTLGIESAGRLGEFGYHLLHVWMKEQGLDGFFSSGNGPGKRWYKLLVEAVDDGLAKGAVARKGGWGGWQFFQNHLAHYEIGKKEAREIYRVLKNSEDGYRGPVLYFLISPKGLNSFKYELNGELFFSERDFHTTLSKHSDDSLKELLKTIMLYETFSRLLQDAFDDCLYIMTRKRGNKAYLNDFLDCKGVKKAMSEIPKLPIVLMERLEPFGESQRFSETFERFFEPVPAKDWPLQLLEHHRLIQREKPPAGKAPWCEQFDDGGWMIYPSYLRDEGGRYDDVYLHGYRTYSLLSFAEDLKLIP